VHFPGASQSTASQTFYYYDLQDRLIEVKNIPNTADPTAYSIYNFYWLEERPVAMWAFESTSGVIARYFMHTDEANRVLEVYSWPTSGDATRVWALNPDEFGWDVTVASSLTYQPLRLNNAILDDQIRAPQSFDAFTHVTTYDRPGLLVRGAVHDPLLGVSLQSTGGWPSEAYAMADHNPKYNRNPPDETDATCNNCGCECCDRGRQGESYWPTASPDVALVARSVGGGFSGQAPLCPHCIAQCQISFEGSLLRCQLGVNTGEPWSPDGSISRDCFRTVLYIFYKCLKDCAYECRRGLF
jgi:hypothetical protein